MNTNFFSMVLVIFVLLFSSVVVASDKEDAASKPEVVVVGDGKVKYVEANGRRLECLVVKTSFFRQQVSCEEMAQTLNPETGKRQGDWQERRLGLAESTTTAGDVVPVLVGGVVSPLISAGGAIRAAEKLGCGENCGPTIINAPAIGITTNTNVNVAGCGTAICDH